MKKRKCLMYWLSVVGLMLLIGVIQFGIGVKEVEASSHDIIQNLEIIGLKETYKEGDYLSISGEWKLPDDGTNGKIWTKQDGFKLKLPDSLSVGKKPLEFKNRQGVVYGIGTYNESEHSYDFKFTEAIEGKSNRQGGFILSTQISLEQELEPGETVTESVIIETNGTIDLGEIQIEGTNDQQTNTGGNQYINDGETFLRKTGNPNMKEHSPLDGVFGWNIHVNYARKEKQLLGPVRIEDELGPYHRLVPGSIRVLERYTDGYTTKHQYYNGEYSRDITDTLDIIEREDGFEMDLEPRSLGKVNGLDIYTYYMIDYLTEYDGTATKPNDTLTLKNVLKAYQDDVHLESEDNDASQDYTYAYAWGNADDRYTGDFLIKKVDAETGLPLANVTFQVVVKNEKVVQGEYAVTTDDKGEAVIKDAPSGIYTLTETNTPEGYETLKEPVSKRVKFSNELKEIAFEVENQPIEKTRLKISKQWEGITSVNEIPAVTFQVKEKDKAGIVDEITVTKDIYHDSFLGSYTFGELPKYNESGKLIEYVVTEKMSEEDKKNVEMGEVKRLTHNEFKVTNIKKKPVLGQLVVEKVDRKGKALSDAAFTLSQKDGVEKQGTTDKKGQLVFTGLALGEYTLTETKAPKGYVLPEKNSQTITLTDETMIEVNHEMVASQTVKVTNELVPFMGEIRVTKQDEATKSVLQGAVFKLSQGDKEVASMTTNDQGMVTFKNLSPGTYTLIETQAPSGYLLDSNPLTIDIKDDGNPEKRTGTINKTVTNKPEEKPILGTIQVIKTDKENEQMNLPGAAFQLTGENIAPTNQVTDADGIITFTDLPLGDYQLTETQAPEGYEREETPITISLTKSGIDDQGILIETVHVTNKKTPVVPDIPDAVGDVLITKVDSKDASVVLPGATFSLWKDGVEVETGTTNDNGQYRFKNLVMGSYVIKEIAAPTGYILTENDIAFTIDSSDAVNGIVSRAFTVNNTKEDEPEIITPVTGKVIVTKTDVEDGTLLSGATFTLTGEAGSFAETSDVSGLVIFDNLPEGIYTLKETKAPEGYALSDTDKQVTISKEIANGEGQVIWETTVTNQKKPVEPTPVTGELVVTKVDNDNNQKTLSGAQFTLTKGSEQRTLETDEHGIAHFTGLTEGEYTLEEVKAPTGYQLSSEKRIISIQSIESGTTNHVVKEVQFANQSIEEIPLLGAFELKKVDREHNELGLKGAIFTLVSKTNKERRYTLVTNEEGYASISELPYDTYHLVEIQAPSGYVLSEESTEIVIDQEVVTRVVTNERLDTPVPVEPEAPTPLDEPTDNKKNMPLESSGKETKESRRNEDKKERLPQTNEQSNMIVTVMGFILLGGAIALMSRRLMKK